jgi:3-oxoacyl-[acyl-carrier-protein] synthase III
MTHSIVILGTGAYSPTKVLTNHDLSKIVDTTDEWIVSRTGIRQRHIAGHHEMTSDMAAKAGQAAIANAGLTPADIDLIICATISPDMPMPSTACLVQMKLDVPAHSVCFDIKAACSGFIYAMDVARSMLSTGRYHHALIIGAEKLSSLTDWEDRNTCVLFGDGAGAAVLSRSPRHKAGIIACDLGAEGREHDLLMIPGGGCLHPASAHSIQHRQHFIKMKGREVFKHAVRVMAQATREILEQNHFTPDQIACVIPHQANLRIIETLSKDLEIPLERFFINLDRHGNTSAASIPLALDEARRTGRIRQGDLTILVAFGAGLTYGSALVRW